jgi:hypothetical protein
MSKSYPDNPNQRPSFEIKYSEKNSASWTFNPEFFPSDFTIMKKKKYDRYGGGCEGETVSLKSVKNREAHVVGFLIESELQTFEDIQDEESPVTVFSPKVPKGGLECVVKQAELGNDAGWDPATGERMFKYTIDLISTGRDEYDSGQNQIVTGFLNNPYPENVPQDLVEDVLDGDLSSVVNQITSNNTQEDNV